MIHDAAVAGGRYVESSRLVVTVSFVIVIPAMGPLALLIRKTPRSRQEVELGRRCCPATAPDWLSIARGSGDENDRGIVGCDEDLADGAPVEGSVSNGGGDVPVVISGLIGPVRSAVVEALSMR